MAKKNSSRRTTVPTGKAPKMGAGRPKAGTTTANHKRVSGYSKGGSYPTPGDNPYGGKR